MSRRLKVHFPEFLYAVAIGLSLYYNFRYVRMRLAQIDSLPIPQKKRAILEL